MDDGVEMRVSGEGDFPVRGSGTRGDLYVRIKVQNSPVFRREGLDVHMNAKVPFHTAILGGYVKIPTLDGEVELKIPSGSQSGETMVMKGKGIPKVSNRPTANPTKGNQYINLHISVPK